MTHTSLVCEFALPASLPAQLPRGLSLQAWSLLLQGRGLEPREPVFLGGYLGGRLPSLSCTVRAVERSGCVYPGAGGDSPGLGPSSATSGLCPWGKSFNPAGAELPLRDP